MSIKWCLCSRILQKENCIKLLLSNAETTAESQGRRLWVKYSCKIEMITLTRHRQVSTSPETVESGKHDTENGNFNEFFFSYYLVFCVEVSPDHGATWWGTAQRMETRHGTISFNWKPLRRDKYNTFSYSIFDKYLNRYRPYFSRMGSQVTGEIRASWSVSVSSVHSPPAQ